MSVQHAHTDALGRQSRRTVRADTYRTRMLMTLALSLALTTTVLKIPMPSEPPRVGWRANDMAPLLQASRSQSSMATRQVDGSVQSFGVPDARSRPKTEPDQPFPGDSDKVPNSDAQRMQARQTVYEIVDSPPEIRGGLGAYYINIVYPEEAVRLGIEGRLLLRFVVDTEGRPTEISVRKSLHPLCDSAAVRALRSTRFVAGSQSGKPVPVRMHLPVRFRLVEAGTLTAARDSIKAPAR